MVHLCVQNKTVMETNLQQSMKRTHTYTTEDFSQPLKKSKAKTKANSKKITPNMKTVTKKIFGTYPVTVNVTPTTNSFSLLQDNSQEVIVDKKQKVRIPPTILFDVSRNDILQSMEILKIQDYTIIPLKRGHQIYCKSIENFKTLIENLKTLKKDFYTHNLPTDKLFKVVILGLYKMETEELEEELKHHNINPESIKIIEPKVARYSEHANYTLFFKKDTVKLEKLREISSLFHVRVRWEPYRNRPKGPTQCTRQGYL